jgi:hypothetical protein
MSDNSPAIYRRVRQCLIRVPKERLKKHQPSFLNKNPNQLLILTSAPSVPKQQSETYKSAQRTETQTTIPTRFSLSIAPTPH